VLQAKKILMLQRIIMSLYSGSGSPRNTDCLDLKKKTLESIATSTATCLPNNIVSVQHCRFVLVAVKTCSEHFLAELEECWQDNILLNGICDVVYKHASNNFSSYVKYCSNQIYIDKTLRGLK
jgi:hypothetical protein